MVHVKNNRFLVTPLPENGESLTSYICRVAKANYLSAHDLWRLMSPENAHYPQSDISSTIDTFPFTSFDLRRFEEFLGFGSGFLDTLTFLNVYRKLGLTDNEIPHSKVLSGLLNKNRKYCPICLQTKRVFKLYWHIREITWCEVHNVGLRSDCHVCHKNIPPIPSNGVNGRCPYCNALLHTAEATPVKIGRFRQLQDWKDALNPVISRQVEISNLSMPQTMAIKALYISSKYIDKSEGGDVKNLPTLLQGVRGSKSKVTYVHFETILRIIRKANISIQDYLSMDIPDEFISNVKAKKVRLIDKAFCLSPWCKGYGRTGTLKRTATSSKVKKDGNKYNYYMYCCECGLEFCFDLNGKLMERGYFISLAYEKVKPILGEEFSLRELAERLSEPQDRIRRAILFLVANNLVNKARLPITVPNKHKSCTIEKIVDGIKKGTLIRQMRQNLGLGYNEFLFYWFLPSVRLAYVNSYFPRHRHDSFMKKQEVVQDTINRLMQKGTVITIKSVCNDLGICPETLRLWGLLPLVRNYKKQQVLRMKILEKHTLMERVRIAINELNANGSEIQVQSIYQALGINRTLVLRKYPDVSKYISSMVKSNAFRCTNF